MVVRRHHRNAVKTNREGEKCNGAPHSAGYAFRRVGSNSNLPPLHRIYGVEAANTQLRGTRASPSLVQHLGCLASSDSCPANDGRGSVLNLGPYLGANHASNRTSGLRLLGCVRLRYYVRITAYSQNRRLQTEPFYEHPISIAYSGHFLAGAGREILALLRRRGDRLCRGTSKNHQASRCGFRSKRIRGTGASRRAN